MSENTLASELLDAYTVSDRVRFLSSSAYFYQLLSERVIFNLKCRLLEKAIAHGAGKIILQYLEKGIWPNDDETAQFQRLLVSKAGFSDPEAREIIAYLYYLAGWEKTAPLDKVQLTGSKQSSVPYSPSSVHPSYSSVPPQRNDLPTQEPPYTVQTAPVYEPRQQDQAMQTPPPYEPPQQEWVQQTPPSFEMQPQEWAPQESTVYEPQAQDWQISPVQEEPIVYEPEITVSEPIYIEESQTEAPVRSDFKISESKLLSKGQICDPITIVDGLEYTPENLYPFFVQKAGEMGLPVEVSIGQLKSGGLLSSKMEDILVLTHSERPRDFFRMIIRITYSGNIAYVSFYMHGDDANYNKIAKIEGNNSLLNKLTGAAGTAQALKDESDRYYDSLGLCCRLVIDEITA